MGAAVRGGASVTRVRWLHEGASVAGALVTPNKSQNSSKSPSHRELFQTPGPTPPHRGNSYVVLLRPLTHRVPKRPPSRAVCLARFRGVPLPFGLRFSSSPDTTGYADPNLDPAHLVALVKIGFNKAVCWPSVEAIKNKYYELFRSRGAIEDDDLEDE